MSEQGAALQTYNQEIVKCLEDFKERRLNLQKIISQEEAEKSNLEKQIKILVDRLNIVNKNLVDYNTMKESYDNAIKATESGFKKLLETSQMLLNHAQRESNRLDNGQYRIKKDVNEYIE